MNWLKQLLCPPAPVWLVKWTDRMLAQDLFRIVMRMEARGDIEAARHLFEMGLLYEARGKKGQIRSTAENVPILRLKIVSDALRDAVSTFGEKPDVVVTTERVEAWKAVLRDNGVP